MPPLVGTLWWGAHAWRVRVGRGVFCWRGGASAAPRWAPSRPPAEGRKTSLLSMAMAGHTCPLRPARSPLTKRQSICPPARGSAAAAAARCRRRRAHQGCCRPGRAPSSKHSAAAQHTRHTQLMLGTPCQGEGGDAMLKGLMMCYGTTGLRSPSSPAWATATNPVLQTCRAELAKGASRPRRQAPAPAPAAPPCASRLPPPPLPSPGDAQCRAATHSPLPSPPACPPSPCVIPLTARVFRRCTGCPPLRTCSCSRPPAGLCVRPKVSALPGSSAPLPLPLPHCSPSPEPLPRLLPGAPPAASSSESRLPDPAPPGHCHAGSGCGGQAEDIVLRGAWGEAFKATRMARHEPCRMTHLGCVPSALRLIAPPLSPPTRPAPCIRGLPAPGALRPLPTATCNCGTCTCTCTCLQHRLRANES